MPAITLQRFLVPAFSLSRFRRGPFLSSWRRVPRHSGHSRRGRGCDAQDEGGREKGRCGGDLQSPPDGRGGWHERHAGQGDPSLAGNALVRCLWKRGQAVAPSGEAGQGRGRCRHLSCTGHSGSRRNPGLRFLGGSVGDRGAGTHGVESWGRSVLHAFGRREALQLPHLHAPLFLVLRKPSAELTLPKTWRRDQQSVVSDSGAARSTFGHPSCLRI